MSLREAAQDALEALEYAWLENEAHPESPNIINDLRDALVEDTRICTCHPDDNPPKPCPRKFALSQCREAAEAEKAEPVAKNIAAQVPQWKEDGDRLEEAVRKVLNPPAALPESAELSDEDAAIVKAWDRFTAELENPSPLTDEEILEMWSPSLDGSVRRPILGKNKIIAFARAVLAAAKAEAPKAIELSDEELYGAIGRAWCHPGNDTKEVDVTLATAIVKELRQLAAARRKE